MTPVPVLLYHVIGDDGDTYSVSPGRFTEDIASVVESGRTPLTMADYVARLRTAQPVDDLVVVSFDDGHASSVTAAQQLSAAGVPCTVYVTTTFLGEPEMMDRAALHDLAAVPGVEIGSHAVHHVRLDELGREALRTEVRDSRHQLEDLLQRPVTGIAYPHGCHDRRVTQEAANAGFTSGAGVKNALSHERDDPMAVARVTLTWDTTAEQVREVLRGQGRLGERRPRLRTRGYRVVRRARHALRG